MAKQVVEEKREPSKRLTIENARLVFRNFAGEPDPWNNTTRTFGVVLDESNINVAAVEADDWYVRRMKPKEDDPEQYRTPWIKVNLKMDGKNPPNVELIKGGRRVKLTEANISQLDWTRIEYADCVIRSYRYDPAKPMSAWLVDLRVKAADSDLESKYASIPYAEDDESVPFD